MEPKTKKQKAVVVLSGKLPEITEKQKEWGFKNLFQKCIVNHRKTYYCLECGQSWKKETVFKKNKCKCSECGQKLEVLNDYHGQHRENEYFAILTIVEGVQVIRMIFASKISKKNQTPIFNAFEVMQHYIDPDGTVTTMSKTVQGLSIYFDQWIEESPIEVRSGSYKTCARYNIRPFKIHPGRRVLKVIKRNGFKGNFHGMAPHGLFSALLTDTYCEALLKAGQIGFLKYYLSSSYKADFLKTYWRSIKICIRRRYIVETENISDWIDYIKLIKHFGKDLHNPKYVCPENLNDAHNCYVSKKRKQDQKQRIEAMRERIENNQIEYVKEKSKFLDLIFSEGDIEIAPLSSVMEFMNEGDELNHCVFTNEYYKKTESLVMSARIKNRPIETIEISLETNQIIQARGKYNQPTKHHEKILNIIQRNMPQIAARI